MPINNNYKIIKRKQDHYNNRGGFGNNKGAIGNKLYAQGIISIFYSYR